MNAHKILTGALLAAVLTGMAGCGKVQEEATEKLIESGMSAEGANVDVEMDSGSEQFNLSATTEEGTVNVSVGPESKIPAEWPKDVTVYPDTTIGMTNVMAEQGNYMIQGTAAAPVGKVSEFYKADMEKQGWAQEQAFSQASGMESFVYKKDERQVAIMLITEGDGTSITLNVSKLN